MKAILFILILFAGCQEQYKFGDLRISVQVNGLNDTSYVVQSYQFITSYDQSKDWRQITPYDGIYKTLAEAKAKVNEIKYRKLRDARREIKVIE